MEKESRISPVSRFILRSVLPAIISDTALGDYEEIYLKISKEKGKLRASLWVWNQIFKSLIPYIFHSTVKSVEMLRNYFKISFRNIVKHKGSSIINLSGLTLGLMCSIMIMLWVNHELSYNKFHKNTDKISRVLIGFGDRDVYSAWGPGPLAPALQEEYPEIINSTRTYQWIDFPLRFEDRVMTIKPMFVDQSFLEIFSFPIVEGDQEQALTTPNQIVLSEETAGKYFDDEDPIGKSMQMEFWGRWYTFNVSAVAANVPENSDLKFDVLVPIKAWENSGNSLDEWDAGMYPSYVLLDENVNINELEPKIRDTVKRRVPETNRTVHLHPLTEVHLHNYYGGGPIAYVYIFSVVGILILFLACINYVNLAAARSAKRAKEIGMRKVAGAKRSQLAFQFFYESAVFAITASIFAVLIIKLILPQFNNILGTNIEFIISKELIFGLISIVILTCLLSGIYPSVILSGFRPVDILKKGGSNRTGKTIMGRLLVTIQSAVSVILIIFTVIIYSQLDHLVNKDLGYNKEQVVNLKLRGSLRSNYSTVRQELLKNPNINSTTMVHAGYANNGSSTYSASWEGKNDTDRILMHVHSVDQDYQETFGFEMAQGRYFSREFATDAAAFVLNEAAVRAIGWDDPIGKRFSYMGIEGEVIGVAKDFNFRSLHDDIGPLIMFMVPGWKTDIYMRLNPGNTTETIDFIRQKVKEIVPDYPFEYTFLEEDVERLYETERRAGTLIRYGAVIAVFISCLGLLGLASNTAVQRIKEIGIRKILGGSVTGIISMLTWEFTKWILAANLIAWPAAWILTNMWLRNFAHKIDVGLIVFLMAGGISLIITIITVGYHSLKAALTNPVDSLRYE
ncbi:MAG: FtsX-like permease family protein [bacterium]|nr:FtsX-like permease family protein [bacterium]